ncbi:uncharacterized protein LOC119074575 [Bradysia coprophila]|uniref:uncharacterized protein LOC119074575 n=1 Tax=Bradysia coprophila TaxID=38358 RepID=UPI00187DD7B6|nr:uncharacterized protein LOC119074575 [Bradysia coprophila]
MVFVDCSTRLEFNKMSTVESDVVIGESSDNKEIREDEDDVDIPEDFFDEFEDNKFLDEIVEIVVPEQARLVRTSDTNENSTEANDEKPKVEESTEPTLKRCLDKINDLTRSIERRKQKLQTTLTKSSKRKRRSHTRSPSPTASRADRNVRNVRSRDRRFSPRRSPSGPRSGRRSRSRDRNRSRDRQRTSNGTRRDRSRSQSSTNRPRAMSFLEELEQKFAEKGQDFPEKELLIQSRSKKNGVSAVLDRQVAATVGYPQCEVPMNMSPYMPTVPMPMYNQTPYSPYWNANYMMNPMATNVQLAMQPLPFQAICAANDPTTMNVIPSDAKANDNKSRGNKDEVIARCRAASKILRGEENKVPKLRFLFTRTSMPMDTVDQEIPPLQSKKNVEFKETSANDKPCAPLEFLPSRTSELVQILGYNCSVIANRLRLKNVGKKVIDEIEDIDAEKQRSKERAYKEIETQTDSYKCPTCVVREAKSFSNKSTQAEAPKKVNIRTQTNEKDYRVPLIRQLSRISAGQLVAVSDFITLICEPRPSTSTEIFSVREKLMDIYNLSERGSDAIEAERARDHEARRRGNNNSCPKPNPPVEDLRSTIRGSSDHNMARIPPPPPLLVNYHMNVGMIDPEQAEREMRLQQMRYEENMRMMQIEEQRNRELEWEHQQQILQQQRQLQLQREQEEENARLQEMRNDRRNGFGRGNNHWNDGRGHARY